jgi:hypothetical protein
MGVTSLRQCVCPFLLQQIPCDDGVVDDLCPAQSDQTIPYNRAKAQVVGGVRTPLNAATPYHDLDK